MPNVMKEYAFSGSLCRICEFQTVDGLRYCLTVFSLSDYKQLHFPHDEYKLLISKLHACLSTKAIFPTNTSNSDAQKLDKMSIKLLPFDGDFKIEFGRHILFVEPVTAIGLVKNTPFADFDAFSADKTRFTCDSNWDICTCKTCPVFSRLIDFEAKAQQLFAHRKPENVIL